MKCEKCNIELDIISNKCPLCNSVVSDKKNIEGSYPILKPVVSNKLYKKVLFFIACIISIVVIILNIALTPTIRWSFFVVLQIFLSYYIFSKILSGRIKVIKILLILNLLVCGISMFWDSYTGFHGWSINYVIPALCISYGIFMIILRFVSYYAFRENSSYIYLNICLEFLPVLLVNLGYAKLNVLVYWSLLFGVINLLLLLIFDGSSFKDDIVKKLHI
jgi:uncharacterized membrane protein